MFVELYRPAISSDMYGGLMRNLRSVMLFLLVLPIAGLPPPLFAQTLVTPRSVHPQELRAHERGALLPGTRLDIKALIQGSALTSTNGVVANGVVRLRDARIGRILETQSTDKAGLFSFGSIDPGTYIVELMANDRSVLATSQMLDVDAGQVISTVVKMPYRVTPWSGLLGHTTASAATILSAAAASGVLATAVTGEPASPIVPINPQE
jgi:hypothetical protein